MSQMTLTFDAVAEPGPEWAARWNRSWPALSKGTRGGNQTFAAICRKVCYADEAELSRPSVNVRFTL